jgi:hypothetical protein
MKRSFLIAALLITALFGFKNNISAQSYPVLYFCTAFESDGEKNITDRFVLGPLIVVVRCDYVLNAKKVTVQFDKYNGKDFDYYTGVAFTIKPGTKYTYFYDVNLRVDDPGIYRCFMLDENKNTIASGLVEFVLK